MVEQPVVPSVQELLDDTARRDRFAATHRAIEAAFAAPRPVVELSDEEIVRLVHRARRATHERTTAFTYSDTGNGEQNELPIGGRQDIRVE